MKNLILDKSSNSINETIQIANDFITSLEDKNCIIILSGDLGAGKTHFTKGLFKGLGFKNYMDVTSPTFDLVNTFNVNNLTTHHCDLYRIDKLSHEDELWLYEILNENGIVIIEWGNKFDFHVNKKMYEIRIEILKEDERQIKIFTD